jgi:hypothetical protein
MGSIPPQPIRNRWAFLVGVNTYIDEAFSRLNFCVRDVLALEKALTHLDYTVVCLHDELERDRPRFPNSDNVEAELVALCNAIAPDDLLLVYFACHGQLVEIPEQQTGQQKERQKKQPVLIVDNSRQSTLAKTGLLLSDVEKLMRGSGAKRLILMLDACHTGVEIGRDISDPEFIRNAYELAEGFALIAASTSQQVAQEWEAVQQGVFTYYLLEGLSGQADRSQKGFVTVDDLKTHVLDGLRRWNVRQGGKIQEPTAKTDGLGDMIVADYRGREEALPLSLEPPRSLEPRIGMGTGVGDRSSTAPVSSEFEPSQKRRLNDLQEQLAVLIAEGTMIKEQWRGAISEVERSRLDTQLKSNYKKAEKIEQEIKEIERASSS